MINKIQLMRHTLTVFLLFLLIACKNQNLEIGKPENYILTEKDISKDCNIYQMRFKEGEYIFKFSLAGSCKSLNADNYIKEYSRYLYTYQDSLMSRRGYIIFDYYGINDKNVLQDSIMNITKKHFKTFVTLSEVDNNGFTIKVFDKKP
jgi:hypothetical protein